MKGIPEPDRACKDLIPITTANPRYSITCNLITVLKATSWDHGPTTANNHLTQNLRKDSAEEEQWEADQ